MWDAKTGARLATLTGHERGVLHVVFSPDGSAMLTDFERPDGAHLGREDGRVAA